MVNMVNEDFVISKVYKYTGPNYYLDRQAIVFNIFLDDNGPSTKFYKEKVLSLFPQIGQDYPDKVIDLFGRVLAAVSKMDMNLFASQYSIETDGEEYVVALEYLDDFLTEEIIYFVRDWFDAMTKEQPFDAMAGFIELQDVFNKTILGGPTIYSLVEAGVKRNIAVNYLYEENVFQWGYGRKHVRARSTTFDVDGIKDTEFTMYKDMVGEFLEMFGFPTPSAKNFFDEEEIVEMAKKLGNNFELPVVVKPVAGHKGQGVVTGIKTEAGVRKAFNDIINSAKEAGVKFDGALVQQQIYGTDHRLLAVGGKFAAALERVPAYVEGNGKDTIEKLIEIDNATEARLDNARSPLCKIKIDDDLKEYLSLQNLTLQYVPKVNEKITLRRVANISAGGVSINVTPNIHPENIKLVEDIASYLKITCLGIDVLCKDISKSWRETPGEFGIIEINAGPGVFMHLAPALGGSTDVPGMIIRSHFKNTGDDRIPILVGNKLPADFIVKIENEITAYRKSTKYGSLRNDGIYLNGKFFTNNERHDTNCKMLFRNPKLDAAILVHSKDDIHDYGIWHQGHDIAILDDANYAEKILKRDLVGDGILFELTTDELNNSTATLVITVSGVEKKRVQINNSTEKYNIVFEELKPFIPAFVSKYDVDPNAEISEDFSVKAAPVVKETKSYATPIIPHTEHEIHRDHKEHKEYNEHINAEIKEYKTSHTATSFTKKIRIKHR